MITWNLSEESANAILSMLGQLPTSSGAYPLLVDLKQQTDSQTEEKKEE
jgi:hypothetical protein